MTDERLKQLEDYRFATVCLDEPIQASDAVDELLKACRALQQQHEQAYEALSHYASPGFWNEHETSGSPAKQDRGKIARETLLSLQSLQGGTDNAGSES